jgi:hypothetical protein
LVEEGGGIGTSRKVGEMECRHNWTRKVEYKCEFILEFLFISHFMFYVFIVYNIILLQRINKISDKSATPTERDEEEENKKMVCLFIIICNYEHKNKISTIILQREFFTKYEKEILAFGKLQTYAQSEKYLIEHPHLSCEWTANHLTLDALNAGITQKENTLKTVCFEVFFV